MIIYKAASALPADDRVAHPVGDLADAGRTGRGAHPGRRRRAAERPPAGDRGLAPGRRDDWTVLGTDDNAPYRVFQDVSGVRREPCWSTG